MAMRRIIGMMGFVMGMCCVLPSVFAADEPTAEAAPQEAVVNDATRQQIVQQIEATRQTDPELAAEMENQLKLLDSGQLHLNESGQEGTDHNGMIQSAQGSGTINNTMSPTSSTRFADTRPNGGLVGPPIDVGGSPVGGGGETALPSEARAKLEKLFQEKGGGDPAKDGAVRAEAEQILREYGVNEYGVNPNEIGPGREGDRNSFGNDEVGGGRRAHEGLERFSPEGLEHMAPEALEHMAPEAREQMERLSEGREREGSERYRELFERESQGVSSSPERESLERAFEGPGLEPRGSETPERATYEAPAWESKTQTRDVETVQPYEAPQPH